MENGDEDKAGEGSVNDNDEDDGASTSGKSEETPEPPKSVKKLLKLARKQSEQLERLSIIASPRKSSVRMQSEQPDPLSSIASPGKSSVRMQSGQPDPLSLIVSPRKSSVRMQSEQPDPRKSSTRKQSEQVPIIVPPRKSSARNQSKQLDEVSVVAAPRNSIKKSITTAAAPVVSEIEPVDDPSLELGKFEQKAVTNEGALKELQLRASISSRKASLKSKLTYVGYAKSNFRVQSAGCCMGKLSIDNAIKMSKKPIREPLLKKVLPQDQKDAVAVFAHLMAYMGDLTSRDSDRENILQVLSGGLRKFEMRDEIYCQICKQTTGNPSSDSNTKGWQAMALCCGMFAPSASFLPTLEAHLEQVVSGTVGKGKNAGSVTDPPRMAAYCLKRLLKIEQTGQRYLLPTEEELEAVEKMGNISATIYLPDSTNKTIPLDPVMTTEEVVVKIVQMLGLSEAKYFCLCEVDEDEEEKTLGSTTYVAEVHSSWAGDCFPVVIDKLHPLQLIGKKPKGRDHTEPNFGEETLNRIFERNSDGDSTPRLLFKRNVFLDPEPGVPETVKNRELAVVYSQAVHDVVRGAYPLSDQELLMLAALQVRAETGSNLPKTVKSLSLSRYLPKYFLEDREEERRSALVNILSGLPLDPSPAVRRFDYLDYLKTQYPLSEASWFFVKQIQNPRLPDEFFVAINGSGVFYLERETKEELLHMTFTEICSWAYSHTTFSIVTGNLYVLLPSQL
ncbi:hypothetical protein R1sor_014862 [Riccia sorocarpa]|uniref:Uncharacterized protein n=1 Tax=Riccia sorocarpa TaxID=122646 RepID=A0ABD3HB27_9MARC